MRSAPIHATAVARPTAGGWRGALLRGPSGAGKSDLAIRLLATGWRLVGDDYVQVWASGGSLYAAPVPTIAGRLEARGLGVVPVDHLRLARIALVVDCGHLTVERLPEPAVIDLAGILVPVLALDIRPASAAETLSMAMRRL